MKGVTIAKRSTELLFLLMLSALFLAGAATAQVPVDEDGNPIAAIEDGNGNLATPGAGAIDSTPLTATELEELVGPVALYPDDLLAIVLPASTYPLEIVQAARFLERLEIDATLEPDESWDESVIALLNYPEVVSMMDDDIDWTWRLGEAVIAQQNDVIAAVESFRDRAYAAGNLKTDERQTVTVEEGVIEIEPVDEEIIYVPYYEPTEVVVYQPRRVYYYYPDPYPVYYYPYPAGYRFRSGLFWGVTTAFNIGWSNHYLHVYHPSYWGHPYYGRSYYDYYYYRRPSVSVYNSWYVTNNYYTSNYRHRDGDYWRPRTRAGSRPDEPRVRNYYYPPNTTDPTGRNRDNMNFSNRDRLSVNNDGRMNLNLRERQGTTSRVGTREAGRASGDTRAVTSSRSTNRNTGAVGSRTTANSSDRVSGATNSRGTARAGTRQATERPEITFRDRGNNAVTSGSSRTTRPSTASTGRRASGAADRLTTSSNRQTVSTPGRTSSANASSRRPTTATPTRRSGSSAIAPSTARSSSPSVRQSAPTVRQSAPSSRSSRPSTPTVRQSAPSSRSSRPSAPSVRQSAPSSRPSVSSSRPSSSGSSSSNRSSRSSSGASQSRRSSSPRVRSQN
jgi:hypothetical protein